MCVWNLHGGLGILYSSSSEQHELWNMSARPYNTQLYFYGLWIQMS